MLNSSSKEVRPGHFNYSSEFFAGIVVVASLSKISCSNYHKMANFLLHYLSTSSSTTIIMLNAFKLLDLSFKSEKSNKSTITWIKYTTLFQNILRSNEFFLMKSVLNMLDGYFRRSITRDNIDNFWKQFLTDEAINCLVNLNKRDDLEESSDLRYIIYQYLLLICSISKVRERLARLDSLGYILFTIDLPCLDAQVELFMTLNNLECSSSSTQINRQHVEYISMIVGRIVATLQEKERLTWTQISRVFALLSRSFVIESIESIQQDILTIVDYCISHILDSFSDSVRSGNREETESCVCDVYYMIDTLSSITGSKTLCWSLPSGYIPADLLVAVNAVDTRVASLLLHDSDSNEYKSIISNTKTKRLSSTSSSSSLSLDSNLQKYIREKFLEFDLKRMSSSTPAWYVEDISFLMDSKLYTTFHENKEAFTLLCWKLMYVLLCLRFIGVWRIIVSNNGSNSTQGLNMSKVFTSTYHLLHQLLGTHVVVQVTCLDILTLLLQNDKVIDGPSPSQVELPNDLSSLLIDHCNTTISSCQDFHSLLWKKANDSCLSLMIALSDHLAIIRREIVRTIGTIHDTIIQYSPFSTSIPLLLVFIHCTDRLVKLNDENEEKFMTLLLASLLTCSDETQVFLCHLIATISEYHPGLIYRYIGRPEVELCLRRQLKNLSLNNDQKDPQQQSRTLVKLYCVLRACTSCVKDVNPKPTWMPKPGLLFHWRVYELGLASRKLLQPSIVTLAVEAVLHARSDDDSIIVLIFAQLLAFLTALMYDVTDGILSSIQPSKNENGHPRYNPHALKDELLIHVVPLLPRPLDVITFKELDKHRKSNTTSPTTSSPASFSRQSSAKQSMYHAVYSSERSPVADKESSPTPSERSGASSTYQKILRSTGVQNLNLRRVFRSKSSTAAIMTPPKDDLSTSPPAEDTKGLRSVLRKFQSQKSMSALTSPRDGSDDTQMSAVYEFPDLFDDERGFIDLISLPSSSTENCNHGNKALEILSERTMDALFAFLCLDEMYPMSTYLRNISIFSHVPVIACVCNTMIQYRLNEVVQKRGVGILKSFAYNQIEVSSLSIHSPLALLSCMKTCGSDSDIQLHLCRIIIIIASYNDIARENILRYNIVIEIILEILKTSSNVEVLAHACQAITSLAQSPRHVVIITMAASMINKASPKAQPSAGVYIAPDISGPSASHESTASMSQHPTVIFNLIIELFKKYPMEKRIQVEGLKALVALASHSDLASSYLENDEVVIVILRRTYKFLHDLGKHDEKLYPDYTREDIASLLHQHRFKGDKCSLM